ncbi:MAG: hypothetical protein AVDCRST_MAG77-5856 [uncultured Chloroflexi bacterium]|uniref:Uncharacterized protein n=1 Tax=uncultured Chloroflexota bacterium TaxID=166587 RepID=A0A6J4KF78_9CHLR|nr:MAG: hypothetical protein AVDCRST_MAG77-5856 [uncultured Chloroflexota bacterium]
MEMRRDWHPGASDTATWRRGLPDGWIPARDLIAPERAAAA